MKYYVIWSTAEEGREGIEHVSKEYETLQDAKFGAELKALDFINVRIETDKKEVLEYL